MKDTNQSDEIDEILEIIAIGVDKQNSVELRGIAEAKAKLEALITKREIEAKLEELEGLKAEPIFQRKVVDNEDLRRRTGYVRFRIRIRGLIDSRLAELNKGSKK